MNRYIMRCDGNGMWGIWDRKEGKWRGKKSRNSSDLKFPQTEEEETMIRFEDLPQELRDAIYIEDCHVSGEHDPQHTKKYVCSLQLRDLAIRVLKTLGINIPNPGKGDIEKMKAEWNKIPRRLDRSGWYAYFQSRKDDDSRKRAEELERWEKDGF